MDLFGLGLGMSCVMTLCALVYGAWSNYVKKNQPSKRTRFLGNILCIGLFLLIFCGVFGKWILDDSLISATNDGDTATVELILGIGLDVNTTQEDSYYTPLMLAAQEGHTDTVKALLRHHPDMNHTGTVGFDGPLTALGLAKAHNHEDIVRLLKAAGAK